MPLVVTSVDIRGVLLGHGTGIHPAGSQIRISNAAFRTAEALDPDLEVIEGLDEDGDCGCGKNGRAPKKADESTAKEAEDPDTPKAVHAGGPWYELPDGTKVRGKANVPVEYAI